MTTLTQIQNALTTQLLTVQNLPSRAAPNVAFKPSLGKPWVRDTFMPVESQVGAIGIDGYDNPQGLYQIDVFCPQNQTNATALAYVDSILEAFERGTILETGGNQLTILKSFMKSPLNHPEFFGIPVMVKWIVYGG